MNPENNSILESGNSKNAEQSENTILESVKSDEQQGKLSAVTPDAIEEQIPEMIVEGHRDQAAADSDIDLNELEEFELSDLVDFPNPKTSASAKETTDDHDPDAEMIESSQSSDEPELFVDSWLDESTELKEGNSSGVQSEILPLAKQKADLQQEIAELKAQKEQLLLQQVQDVQETLGRMIEEGTQELRERKTALRIEIDKLERRRERINQEMRSNFAGSSKELAIRVQGFKEYLVGSLQDLASAAEKLELGRTETPSSRNRERVRSSEDPRREARNVREGGTRERSRDSNRERGRNLRGNDLARGSNSGVTSRAQFSEPTFADQSRRIRQLLDKYCNSPDYYGAPWQLRRTFGQNQAKKVQEWFFSQGGRGAIESAGSRLQNILLASATISILHDLYRDLTQVLILTDTPENLGEWRKGLEDCLGISRRDFGTNRGVVLFDSPDILVQRAERLLADKMLPIIVIDETEEQLNLSVLKFPIWLAFASTNKPKPANYLY